MNMEVNGPVAHRAVIAGHGSFVPAKILNNEDLSKMVDTSDEWITTRTGIKERHIASDSETTAYLASEAAKKALSEAGIAADQLDLILLGTITPEMVFPSTACFVQHAIGAVNAAAIDLAAACSGFVYGLSIAQQFIESGRYRNILVIGAETLSKIANWKDRASCILFGDGAGAVVLKGVSDGRRGIIYSTMHSDGSRWRGLRCVAYGSRNPVSRELKDPDMKLMNIEGREVYQQAVRRIVEAIEECMDKCALGVDDVKMVISHQMNARIIESVSKRIDFPMEKIFLNIEKYGNTSAASVPIAFDDCVRRGNIRRGDVIIFVAFGSGFTWGANVIEF